MKLSNIITVSSSILVAALLAASCVKPTGKDVATEQYDYSNKAFVQVFNASVNTTRNYVYVDGNAVTGAALAYGGTFPSTPANFAVTSGVRAFLIRDTSSTVLTQPLMSFGENFEAGRYYTIFMYDTSTAVKNKAVPNNVIIPDDTTARLRFANFIYNPGIPAGGAPSAFDVFSVKRNANIFTNVQNLDVTDYIPYASLVLDTFYIRPTGSATNLQNFSATGVGSNIQTTLNPTRKRSYTLIFRGGYRSSGTTNTFVRSLSTFANN